MAFLILLSLCLLSWRGTWGQQDVARVEVKEAKEGGTVRIPCMSYGSEHSWHPTIQWLYEKNGMQKMLTNGTSIEDSELKERVTLGEHFRLIIRSVRVQDERIFICRAANTSSVSKEHHVQLRVYKAPEPPEMKLVDVGILLDNDSVEIGSCESKNGYPSPNITWYKNGFPLRDGHADVKVSYQLTQESSGFYTVLSSLFINVQQSDDNSVFYCEVSYSLPGHLMMMESAKGNITVYYPNTQLTMFKKSPTETVKEGDTVELKCEGNGNPQPEITYYKRDEDRDLGTGPSLILKKVERGDSGGYSCVGTDYNYFSSDLSADIELQVHFLDSPKLSEESPVVVKLGEDLRVSCQANGSVETEITWTRKENLEAEGMFLNLNDVNYGMSGIYTCLVDLPAVPGLNVSMDLEVIITGRPEVHLTSQHIAVEENQMVTLTCQAIGHPVPSIIWSINGTVAEIIDGLEVTSDLTFPVTHDLINVTVTCEASNTHGNSQGEVQLELKPVSIITSAAPVTTVTTGTSSEPTKAGSHGVVIVVVIVCILLLAILGAVLYFLYKKGHIPCGRSGKQDITKPSEKDQIVVEMKPDSPAEESVLLPGSQEKKPPGEQEKYMDLRN
ncbi:cell surface glycoprotein MUC18 [Spea bombifrons]|uniref:cell surface glycoprotein MUC18 n=1 Tax=Spea bombifrons TaxID=233779 RepID=UPI002349E3E4|nr:cell surface glycoprotein MUC18 [Spea bombifrons]